MEFDSIYNTYWQKIYRVCCGYLGDPDWAKDVAQDTFIAVWNNLGNFRNEASVSTWIYRIAVNNCLRQLERSKRLPKSEVHEQLSENHAAGRKRSPGPRMRTARGRLFVSYEMRRSIWRRIFTG